MMCKYKLISTVIFFLLHSFFWILRLFAGNFFLLKKDDTPVQIYLMQINATTKRKERNESLNWTCL